MTSLNFLVGTKSGEIGAECFEHIGTFLSHRRNTLKYQKKKKNSAYILSNESGLTLDSCRLFSNAT